MVGVCPPSVTTVANAKLGTVGKRAEAQGLEFAGRGPVEGIRRSVWRRRHGWLDGNGQINALGASPQSLEGTGTLKGNALDQYQAPRWGMVVVRVQGGLAESVGGSRKK